MSLIDRVLGTAHLGLETFTHYARVAPSWSPAAGRGLSAAFILSDATQAAHSGSTAAGKLTRGVTQAGLTALMAAVRPVGIVASAEAVVFSRPHITGIVRVLPQALGTVVDAVAEGDAFAPVMRLSHQIESGQLGAVVSGLWHGCEAVDHFFSSVVH